MSAAVVAISPNPMRKTALGINFQFAGTACGHKGLSSAPELIGSNNIRRLWLPWPTMSWWLKGLIIYITLKMVSLTIYRVWFIETPNYRNIKGITRYFKENSFNESSNSAKLKSWLFLYPERLNPLTITYKVALKIMMQDVTEHHETDWLGLHSADFFNSFGLCQHMRFGGRIWSAVEGN